MRLSQETVEEFHRDGFVRRLGLLESGELQELRTAVDEIRCNLDVYADRLYEVEQAYTENPDEVVCHFLGSWLLKDVIRNLVFDRRVTEPLAQLLGVESLRFWHDQVFYKPPRHRGVVPWHQDYSYWQRTVPAQHISIFLALEDADEANGCLQYVPGSHRWGLLPPVPFDSQIDDLHASLSEDQVAEFKPVPIELAAGEASIHHSHTIHGSNQNHSDRSRCGLVLNYMAADTRSASDEPLLKHVPAVASGSIIDGAHFPIVLG